VCGGGGGGGRGGKPSSPSSPAAAHLLPLFLTPPYVLGQTGVSPTLPSRDQYNPHKGCNPNPDLPLPLTLTLTITLTLTLGVDALHKIRLAYRAVGPLAAEHVNVPSRWPLSSNSRLFRNSRHRTRSTLLRRRLRRLQHLQCLDAICSANR